MARTSKRPTGRKTLLTPEVEKAIVDAVERGCYLWVAAEAVGIPRKTLTEWLARGEGTDPERPQSEPFASFAVRVRQAQARARKGAEARVYAEDARFWLRTGPGRDRGEDAPGWTESSKIDVSAKVEGPVHVVLPVSIMLPTGGKPDDANGNGEADEQGGGEGPRDGGGARAR